MNIELQSMAIELPQLDSHPNRAPFRGVLTLVDAPSDKPPAGARGHRVMLTRAAAERALPSLLGMGLDYTPSLDRHDTRRKIGIITEAEIQTSLEAGMVERPFRAAMDRSQQAASAEGLRSSGAKARCPILTATPSEVRGRGKGGDLRAAHPSAQNRGARVGRPASLITVAGYLYARDFPEVMHELRAGGRSMLGMSYEIADARVAESSAPIWTITQFTFTGAALLRRDKAAYRDTWIELS
ncbi:MAG: hypothetical protein ACE14M_00310 [Terriglobales bacterium]